MFFSCELHPVRSCFFQDWPERPWGLKKISWGACSRFSSPRSIEEVQQVQQSKISWGVCSRFSTKGHPGISNYYYYYDDDDDDDDEKAMREPVVLTSTLLLWMVCVTTCPNPICAYFSNSCSSFILWVGSLFVCPNVDQSGLHPK